MGYDCEHSAPAGKRRLHAIQLNNSAVLRGMQLRIGFDSTMLAAAHYTPPLQATGTYVSALLDSHQVHFVSSEKSNNFPEDGFD